MSARPVLRAIGRWTKRILLGVIGLVVVSVATVLIAIHTDWGRDKVRGIVETQLDDVFVGGVTIGKLEGSPFGELVARDVTINAADGKPAFKIATLRVKLKLWSLVHKTAEIDKLVVEDLDVTATRERLAGLTKPGPSSHWTVEIHDLSVRGSVAFEGTHIDHAAIDARFDMSADGVLRVVAALGGTWREKANAPIDAFVAVENNGRFTRIPALSAHVGGAYGAAIGVTIEARASDARDVLEDAGMIKPRCMSPGSVPLPATLVACVPVPRAEVLPPRISGILVGKAIKAALQDLPLPSDVWGLAILQPVGDDSAERIDLVGSVCDAHLRAGLIGDPVNKTATGFARVSAVAPAAGAALAPDDVCAKPWRLGDKVPRSIDTLVGFDVDASKIGDGSLPIGAASLLAWAPGVAVSVIVGSDGKRVVGGVGGEGEGAEARAVAQLRIEGERIVLEHGHVLANVPNIAALPIPTKGAAGALHADITAHGMLVPSPDLEVSGFVDGKKLRYTDAQVATLRVDVHGHNLPSNPSGAGTLVANGIDRADLHLDTLTLTAASRADGAIDVGVRSQPKSQRWLVDVDATVRRARTIAIDIVRHHVRASDLDWIGSRGHIEIGPDGYVVKNFTTTSARGTVKLDASYTANGQVAVDARVAGPLGTATVTADIDGPRPSAPAGWQHLSRTALRKIDVAIAADLGTVAQVIGAEGPVAGRFDLDAHVVDGDVTATGKLSNLHAPALREIGPAGGTFQLAAPTGGGLDLKATGRVDGVGGIELAATAKVPDRALDAAAWKALGRDALEQASLRVKNIDIDPSVLERFGVQAQIRGRTSLAIEAGPGARSVALEMHVIQLRGGSLAMPIDVHGHAAVDDKGARADVTVSGGIANLAVLHATTPITLAQLIADPKAAKAAPITGTLVFPSTPARRLLETFGRDDVVSGNLEGTVELAGTIGKPTAVAKLIAKDIAVPPGHGGTQRLVTEMTFDATWDGTSGTAKLAGRESTGGTLQLVAKGAPGALDKMTVDVEAKAFDLRPLAAFAPGPSGAVAGTLDGTISITGIDPRTGEVHGKLVAKDARIPIAPSIGTLRNATIELAVADRKATLAIDGKIGRGTIKLRGHAPLSGDGLDATIELRQVSPIAAVEPVIDANITATLRRKNDRWDANVKVDHGVIVITDEKGQKLDPIGVPPDFHYGSRDGAPTTIRPAKQPDRGPAAPPAPVRPDLVCTIEIGSTRVESAEIRTLIDGKLKITVGGTGPGQPPVRIVGNIAAKRGDLDLFGRRYQVDHAFAHFDGSTDPVLDARITYDFPDVTTITEIRGRLSKPELVMRSEPGRYSQDELLGFLMGGEPNGDPTQSQTATSKVEGAGAGYVANQIGGFVKKQLPIDLDVLKYEAASATNSASVTVGTWLTHELFLAYRHHLEARPDENTGEAEAEYWIKPQLSVQGTIGDRADGLDLLWRRRW